MNKDVELFLYTNFEVSTDFASDDWEFIGKDGNYKGQKYAIADQVLHGGRIITQRTQRGTPLAWDDVDPITLKDLKKLLNGMVSESG